MDFTAIVGLLGAAVGGSIGLLGQRMSLREQRRKELRERVVEFLRDANRLSDAIYDASLVPLVDRENAVYGTTDPALARAISDAIDSLHQSAQHLELLASGSLYKHVAALQELVLMALDRAVHRERELTDADYKEQRDAYDVCRNDVISHFKRK